MLSVIQSPELVLNDSRRSRCLIQYFTIVINKSGQHTGPNSNSHFVTIDLTVLIGTTD